MRVYIPYNVCYILYRKPVWVSSFRLVAVRRTVIVGGQVCHQRCWNIGGILEASLVRSSQITVSHSVVAVILSPANKLSLFIILSVFEFVQLFRMNCNIIRIIRNKKIVLLLSCYTCTWMQNLIGIRWCLKRVSWTLRNWVLGAILGNKVLLA